MASETENGEDVLAERHYTVSELAEMWKLSPEFVRQIVRVEPGVTEWVRQAPGRRRYRVLRVPASVAARLYRRAQGRAEPAIQQLSRHTGGTKLSRAPAKSRRETRRSFEFKYKNATDTPG